MKSLTRIVLIALAGAVLVFTGSCKLTKGHASPAPSASSPIPITSSSALNPWAETCTFTYSTATDLATCTITVPDTEEIVIQTISGQQIRASTSQLSTKVSTTGGGATTYWYTVVAPVLNAGGSDEYLWSYPVTLYADPGSSITVTVSNLTGSLLSVPAGNGVTLVGYYVTAPTS